ncbi:hypothetical protein CCHOA_00430 [Corynebacterium choanae]|uniref:Uncharacterized protein n=2 Tax=Corynebacterium choanae TaxID=1862358 RepID=A0A3G6J380_9CORY|nr:hypothetical protein CCHOA_00430 [Corynebacterium choanae]
MKRALMIAAACATVATGIVAPAAQAEIATDKINCTQIKADMAEAGLLNKTAYQFSRLYSEKYIEAVGKPLTEEQDKQLKQYINHNLRLAEYCNLIEENKTISSGSSGLFGSS